MDAGHGQEQLRRPGVFDLGCGTLPATGETRARTTATIAATIAATEADFALRYAIALDDALRARGFPTLLTRPDNTVSCSLRQRLALAQAKSGGAAGQPAPERGPTPKVQEAQTRQAQRVDTRSSTGPGAAAALPKPSQPAPSASICRLTAGGLCGGRASTCLRYDPSVLVEVGFLDSDEDFALLGDDLFKVAAMESVAGAVANAFRAEDLYGLEPETGSRPNCRTAPGGVFLAEAEPMTALLNIDARSSSRYCPLVVELVRTIEQDGAAEGSRRAKAGAAQGHSCRCLPGAGLRRDRKTINLERLLLAAASIANRAGGLTSTPPAYLQKSKFLRKDAKTTQRRKDTKITKEFLA